MCAVLQAATSSDQTLRKNAENTLKQASDVSDAGFLGCQIALHPSPVRPRGPAPRMCPPPGLLL